MGLFVVHSLLAFWDPAPPPPRAHAPIARHTHSFVPLPRLLTSARTPSSPRPSPDATGLVGGALSVWGCAAGAASMEALVRALLWRAPSPRGAPRIAGPGGGAPLLPIRPLGTRWLVLPPPTSDVCAVHVGKANLFPYPTLCWCAHGWGARSPTLCRGARFLVCDWMGNMSPHPMPVFMGEGNASLYPVLMCKQSYPSPL